MKISSKRTDVPPTLVPGYRQTLPDLTEEMMSGAVGDLFYLQLELSVLFKPDVLELNLRPFVVDLQSDGSVGQLSGFGVVGELGSEFAVDEELEVVSAGNDADVVPLVWANIRHGERSGDGA